MFWWKLPDGNRLLVHYQGSYGTPLLPPESWERRHSPFEDSAAQRRIAALIAKIAERRKVEEEAAERLRDRPH